MTYVPHTDAERAAMMQAIGIEDIEDIKADLDQALKAALGK